MSKFGIALIIGGVVMIIVSVVGSCIWIAWGAAFMVPVWAITTISGAVLIWMGFYTERSTR